MAFIQYEGGNSPEVSKCYLKGNDRLVFTSYAINKWFKQIADTKGKKEGRGTVWCSLSYDPEEKKIGIELLEPGDDRKQAKIGYASSTAGLSLKKFMKEFKNKKYPIPIVYKKKYLITEEKKNFLVVNLLKEINKEVKNGNSKK